MGKYRLGSRLSAGGCDNRTSSEAEEHHEVQYNRHLLELWKDASIIVPLYCGSCRRCMLTFRGWVFQKAKPHLTVTSWHSSVPSDLTHSSSPYMNPVFLNFRETSRLQKWSVVWCVTNYCKWSCNTWWETLPGTYTLATPLSKDSCSIVYQSMSSSTI